MYKGLSYAIEAIDSALKQDYSNKEIVVSDDFSHECLFNSLKSRYSHLEEVRLSRNRENLGRVMNYNKLLYELSKGELILCLDGDDVILDPELISKSVRLLEMYPEAVFVQSRIYRCVEKPTTTIFNDDSYIIYSSDDYIYNIWGSNRFNHQTTIYYSQKAKTINFYTADIISSDAESIARLGMTGPVIMRNERGVFWRNHGENASEIVSIKLLVNNAIVISNNLYEALSIHNPKKQHQNNIFRKKITIQLITPLFLRAVMSLNLPWIVKLTKFLPFYTTQYTWTYILHKLKKSSY